MKSIVVKSDKVNVKRWIGLGSLIVVALANLSCSTPPGGDGGEDADYSSTSWNAYQSCVQARAPLGQEAFCDNVLPNSGNASSYRQFNDRANGTTFGGRTSTGTSSSSSSSTGYYRETPTISPNHYYGQQMNSPYFRYLKTVEVEDVQDMEAQWAELASEQAPEQPSEQPSEQAAD